MAKKNDNKNLPLLFTIIGCSLLIAGSLIFLGVQLGNSGGSTAEITANRNDSLTTYFNSGVADTEHDDAILGDPSALVTIVEYSDYQCPFCRSFYNNAYQDITRDFIDTGKARLIFKDFPLDFHDDAVYTANAAECVRDLTDDAGYYAFHDAIFDAQNSMGVGTVAITNNMVLAAAQLTDAPIKEFKKCAEDKRFHQEIANDVLASMEVTASRLAQMGMDGNPEIVSIPEEDAQGVSATPTVLVGDIKVVGAQPYEVFKLAIETIYAENNSVN